MTYLEAQQHLKVLEGICDITRGDLRLRLAIFEDEVQNIVTNTSPLFAYFQTLKADAENDSNSQQPSPDGAKGINAMNARCQELVNVLRARLSSVPPAQEEIEIQVSKAIEKGFLRSWAFRIITVIFGLLLAALTGVATFKLYTQFEAMQNLLDKAQAKMEQSGSEIRTINDHIKDNQAALALSLLEGNEKMAQLRTGALQEMVAEEQSFKTSVDKELEEWKKNKAKPSEDEAEGKITNAGTSGETALRKRTSDSSEVIDGTLRDAKTTIDRKTNSTLAALQAARSSWIPLAVWSHLMSWIMVPIALAMTLLAWLSVWLVQVQGDLKGARILSVANVVFVCAVIGLVFWLRFRG